MVWITILCRKICSAQAFTKHRCTIQYLPGYSVILSFKNIVSLHSHSLQSLCKAFYALPDSEFRHQKKLLHQRTKSFLHSISVGKQILSQHHCRIEAGNHAIITRKHLSQFHEHSLAPLQAASPLSEVFEKQWCIKLHPSLLIALYRVVHGLDHEQWIWFLEGEQQWVVDVEY